jgi:hypothetical protein
MIYMTEQTTFDAETDSESTPSESAGRGAADHPDAPDLDDDHPLANFRAAVLDDWESATEARAVAGGDGLRLRVAFDRDRPPRGWVDYLIAAPAGVGIAERPSCRPGRHVVVIEPNERRRERNQM